LASEREQGGASATSTHPVLLKMKLAAGGEAEPADEITGGGAGPAELQVREQGNTARARRSQWGRGAGGAL